MPPADAPSPSRDLTDVPWVIAAAALLTLVGGYVGAVLLQTFYVPVSFMSGAVLRLGADLRILDGADLVVVVGSIAGFFAGATVSGVIVGTTRVRFGRRYGVVLMLEGALLALAGVLLAVSSDLGIVLAALACGLQNGMASNYRGLVLRTTHVTGAVTDLGLLLGHWLRHGHVDRWRVALLLVTVLAFFGGAVAGVTLGARLGPAALWPPAGLAFALGLGYYLLRAARGRATGGAD